MDVRIKDSIATFLTSELRGVLDGPLNEDKRLLSNGILDSVSKLNLVLFLEKEFKITIERHEVILKNFETLLAITQFVEMKQARDC